MTADRLPDDGSEPSAALVAALANRIADLLTERIGDQLAQLLTDRRLGASIESPSSNVRTPSTSSRELLTRAEARLWSAREIAGYYGVTVNFVYQHADELGCVRLGHGTRARLRFYPNVAHQRWQGVGETLDEPSPSCRRRASRTKTRTRSRQTDFELLEFEREQ